jgi:hypothetical protein
MCVCVERKREREREKDLLFEWTQIQDDQQRIPAGMEWLVYQSLRVHACACLCMWLCVCEYCMPCMSVWRRTCNRVEAVFCAVCTHAGKQLISCAHKL